MNTPEHTDGEHVGEWVADYVFDRLDEITRRRVDQHLARCEECAEDFRFAARLRGEAHLAAERVVEIADGAGTTTEAERDHLRACDRCRHEVEVLAALPAPAELRERTAPVRRARTPRRWRPAAAMTVLAAAAVIVLALLPRGDDLSGFAQLQPLPVRIVRSQPDPGSFEALRLDGLAAYRDRDYVRAEIQLGEALVKRPSDAELWLYRGSAQLVLGETRTAAESLRRAAELDDAEVGTEARWQRVQALLVMGDGETARAELATLAESGRRVEDAKTLLEQLDSR